MVSINEYRYEYRNKIIKNSNYGIHHSTIKLNFSTKILRGCMFKLE